MAAELSEGPRRRHDLPGEDLVEGGLGKAGLPGKLGDRRVLVFDKAADAGADGPLVEGRSGSPGWIHDFVLLFC